MFIFLLYMTPGINSYDSAGEGGNVPSDVIVKVVL